jgi:hypothetical protein
MLNLLSDVCVLFKFIGSRPSLGKRKPPLYTFLWLVIIFMGRGSSYTFPCPHHEGICGAEVKLHSFLTSALNGDE